MIDLQLSSLFINQLLTMGLPAIDDSLMRLLTAMETFPKSAILGSAISFAKMLGLLLALCMGSYECWMMMLGRRGMDVMKLARRSEEHTSELQSHSDLVCRLLLEKIFRCR